jgi:hypothetical protein
MRLMPTRKSLNGLPRRAGQAARAPRNGYEEQIFGVNEQILGQDQSD